MARIIVTGAAGLIGSNLVKALNACGERDLLLVDHLNHPAKQANLDRLVFRDYLDKAAFRDALCAGGVARADVVVHLGACSSTTETDAAYLRANNLDYTEALCRWALAHDARFVYASSAATYGDGRQGYADADAITPTLKPLNLYGQSKQDFDCLALREGWLRRIVGLKYFNVFGPGEDHKGEMRSLVHKAYGQIEETGGLSLFRSHRPDYRDGEQCRDFVYVEDAVAVTLYFLDHPEVSGLFNCGTGRARTWRDLAHALFAAMGREPRIAFVDMPEAIRDRYQYHTEADLRKLRSVGCRHAFVALEDAIRDYVKRHLAVRASGV